MTNGRWGRAALALAWLWMCGTSVSAEGTDQPATPQGATRRVIAGRPAYDRSGWFKLHFGEGYRKYWTTPFEAKVLDLATYAGGLTAVRQVGSMQSIGLALEGADGKSYTFRTLDKDPTRSLPEEWRESFPAELFQDQTIANHPGGAMIVPVLAEAAGVPHTNPEIVFMPDDPALGEFRATFGGQPGTIDEYPLPAGGQLSGFHGSVEIIPTRELWKRWQKGQARVDTAALVHDRIFDLFLGDWDRHDRQWRWMKLPGQDALVPLPEDRDQAFANFSGLVMSLARSVQKKLVAWHDDFSNLDGLLVQPREVDGWLLTGVERAAFVDAARDLQARLTDPVIESAVRRLPPEWFAIGGEQLIRDLKKRRGLLVQAAEGFYEHLARYVDVQGTDEGDVARLLREADGSVTLEMSLESGGNAPPLPYLRRRFLPGETKEVRIYLYGGRDHFVATGPRDGITVRVSGGAQKDVLDDSHSGGTRFYDAEEGEVVQGRGTGVSTRPWARVPSKPNAPWMEKVDYGSLMLLQPLLWWEPDPGIVLSMGATRYTYSFRKLPYSTMQHAAVEWKTKRGAFGASYAGDFRWARPGYATFVELSADAAENYNFYGFGNESPFVSDDFNEADQKEFVAFPSLVAYENHRRTLWYALGPEVKFSQNRAEGETLLGQQQPYGFGDFGQVGARLEAHVDTRGRLLAGLGLAGLAPGTRRTDTGLKAEIQGRIYPKAWDVEETFGVAFGEVTGYLQVAPRLTLAARVGGQKNWGRHPWYESAFIGGSDNVRGYDRNRFAGDASAYANAQVMVTLFNMNLILPLRVGVLGLADAGRVWVEGEDSGKWHPSAGGGLFVRVMTAEIAFHGILASSEEGVKFYVNIGFGI